MKNPAAKKLWTVLRAALCLLLCVSMCGCSMSLFDVEKLMRPPLATGNKEALHRLLLSDAGEELDFVYPRSGDFRSAVITAPFAGEQTSGAIAFCRNPSGGTTLYFTLLEDGEWRIVSKVESPTTQVDRVSFGDLDGDGTREVIVSWGNVQSLSSILSVYDYNGSTIKEHNLTRPYGEFVITDLNGDGQNELFVAEFYRELEMTKLTAPTEEHVSLALLYELDGNELVIRQTVALDPNVVYYTQVAVGSFSPEEKNNAVFLDGVRIDNTAVTQLVYMEKETNLLQAPLSGASNFTSRPSAVSLSASIGAADIDSDGCYELPALYKMPLPGDMAVQPVSYIVSWQKFVPHGNTVTVKNTVVNGADSYMLEMPDIWLSDNVTCRYEPSTKTFTVYEVKKEDNTVMLAAALLKVRRYSRKEWDSLAETENYTAAYTQNNVVLAVSLPSPDNELSLAVWQIANYLLPIPE